MVAETLAGDLRDDDRDGENPPVTARRRAQDIASENRKIADRWILRPDIAGGVFQIWTTGRKDYIAETDKQADGERIVKAVNLVRGIPTAEIGKTNG